MLNFQSSHSGIETVQVHTNNIITLLFQSSHSGIETPKGLGMGCAAVSFQSSHSGIETSVFNYFCSKFFTSNHPIVELKLDETVRIKAFEKTSNHPIVELKHGNRNHLEISRYGFQSSHSGIETCFSKSTIVFKLTSNHPIVELKLPTLILANGWGLSSNHPIVELKLQA